jgi:alanine dehydrogenase
MNIRVLTRAQVAGLLTFPECVEGVERAFRLHAEGKSLAPQLMHVDANGGEFHVKGGGLLLDRWYFALKANGSFFDNPSKRGLPAIQGGILLFDAENGTPLALLDSGEITVQRTGAATAVAAKHFARPDSTVATICGCGKQGRIQLTALRHSLPVTRIYVWDVNPEAARRFAGDHAGVSGLTVEAVEHLEPAVTQSDVVVTCTPARVAFVRRAWIRPGTFVAAVGSDSPGKQELDADVLAPPTVVVVDLLDQAAQVGELQHAIAAGHLAPGGVHAELGEVIAGRKPGRRSSDEVIVFDATGTALQDAVAAATVYRRAIGRGVGTEIDLSGSAT